MIMKAIMKWRLSRRTGRLSCVWLRWQHPPSRDPRGHSSPICWHCGGSQDAWGCFYCTHAEMTRLLEERCKLETLQKEGSPE